MSLAKNLLCPFYSPFQLALFHDVVLEKRTMAEAKRELLVKQGGSREAPVPEGLSLF